MSGTNWNTAPMGHKCCPFCHRYLPPEKLEDGRCPDRDACHRAAARMVGRPRKLTKRGERIAKMGEAHS